LKLTVNVEVIKMNEEFQVNEDIMSWLENQADKLELEEQVEN
jgi:hypothetical protein